MNKSNNLFAYILTFFAIFYLIGCSKTIESGIPKTDLVGSAVFNSDATAIATIIGLYNQMVTTGFASGDQSSATLLLSLSSDELNYYSTSSSIDPKREFYANSLAQTNSLITSNIWSEPYQYIYKANMIIEGVSNSVGLSAAVRSQLIGEAKFIRAFSHFYLLNLFGDVPLVVSTDYRVNNSLYRSPKQEVYKQIVSDLTAAKELLNSGYVKPDNSVYPISSAERVRPNKWAAVALLARVYLFKQDWINAEKESSLIIGNKEMYNIVLSDINGVFLKNSVESIWQLSRVNANTWDATTFTFTSTPTVALNESLVNAFEAGDKRRSNWIGTVTVGTSNYYYSKKYKLVSASPISEYSTVLRLAEQYLIRSEARAHLNSLNTAIDDLNEIRNRAGLSKLGYSLSQGQILSAIEGERRLEFFTEWGHRWLDLKRTSRADTVLKLIKTATWQADDTLYPIPQVQLLNDPNMINSQNPGY